MNSNQNQNEKDAKLEQEIDNLNNYHIPSPNDNNNQQNIRNKNKYEEEKEKDNLDEYDEVEEEELPKSNWTFLVVKSLTSEEKLKVSKKGRKEIEEENNMRESYEKLKKDINLVEKQNLEDMTYKNAIVVLHTKILPAEELINEIKEKNLFSKNEVTNFGKKILIMKTNYQNIIKKKEEEHSQLEAFKINQQELGKKNFE